MDRSRVFIDIYKANAFNGKESLSGTGSDLAQTATIRKELVSLCQKLKIKTLIDVCGDYHWMKEAWKELSLYVDNYIGIDIVPEMVEKNDRLYSSANVKFLCKDIVTSALPEGDMLLCRDVLVHLSYESTLNFLKNFERSDIQYLLVTTFNRSNINIEDGSGWYPIDLTKLPFGLVKPELLINEGCTEQNGEYKDKSLGLWNRSNICGT